VSRARFESKLMPASTAYRMTVYRHRNILDSIELVLSHCKVRLSPRPRRAVSNLFNANHLCALLGVRAPAAFGHLLDDIEGQKRKPVLDLTSGRQIR
jgi:hypothetical protein